MTVIAYKDGILAADKQSTWGGLGYRTRKIKRLGNGSLVGCAGNSAICRQLIDWIEEGAEPELFPDDKNECHMLLVRPNGTVWLYDGKPRAIELEEEFVAFGSGKEYAIATMHLGFDARRAVEVACHYDRSCGKGIDALELGPAA